MADFKWLVGSFSMVSSYSLGDMTIIFLKPSFSQPPEGYSNGIVNHRQ